MSAEARARTTRALVAVLLAVGLGLAFPASASAHVTVTAEKAEPGEWTVLTFQVPVESDTARTVALTVDFPADTPFTSVDVRPTAGWEARVVSGDLPEPVTGAHGQQVTRAIERVEWKATGAGLKPGEFGQFAVSAGPLPEKAGTTVHFPAIQTYSDRSKANWVQQVEGDAEPEFPAPSITVGAAEQASAADDSSRDGLTLGLAVAGIALALLAGALGGAALARSRR